jgi:hypothetical protein
MIDYNKFYVYAYIDPNTDTPFYIGMGCHKRATTHLLCSKYYISITFITLLTRHPLEGVSK